MTQQTQRPDPSVQPARSVQPVRVTYGTTWLHYLIVVGLIIAWWFPVKLLISHWLWPQATYDGPRDAETFVALAFEGVSSKTNEVSTAQFKRHVQALKANGYVPIGLEDVRLLFKEGKLLPRKSVLLTFDHARKTSYYNCDPILRRMGWNAVMFLWVESIVEEDPASLLWPYVRIMLRSKSWEIGAESYSGFKKIQVGPSGKTGHYMTSPRWLPKKDRYETVDEFQERLVMDHQTALAMIKQRTGHAPIAFAYPYGDFGQYQSRAVVPRSINLALVDKYYDLGFLSGNLALNTRYSDPLRLNRLRVRSRWTADDLIRYLDRSWPLEETRVETDTAKIPSAWIVDWGSMKREGDSLVLYATSETTGAKMWLGGSDLSRDFYARVSFRLERGQMGIYLRAAADEESYVYLGLDSQGEIWLREKKMGRELVNWADETINNELNVWLRQKSVSIERFTLASTQVTIDPEADHIVEIFVRGRLLFAMLDGEEIFHENILLRGKSRPGMLGISVWNPNKGLARVSISSVVLNSAQRSLVAWDVESLLEPYVLQWLHRQAYRLTELSPTWKTVSGVGQVMKTALDTTLYRTFANVYQLKLVPRVKVQSEAALNRIVPSSLADDADENKFDGIFLDLEGIRDPTISGVATWLMQCASVFKEKELTLLVRLPVAFERRTTLGSILAVAPGLQLAVSTNSTLSADADTQGKVARVEDVPEPPPGMVLPLSFEIPASPGTNLEETVEMRIVRLRQEGQAAFQDAKYDLAAELWSEWSQLTPFNPRPSMLVGDAFMRKGDTKQAIASYDRSLALNPGQVRLALRRASLLAKIGRVNDAMNSIMLYARVFPNEVSILLTQANWLWRQGRSEEALPLVRRIIKLEPDHVEASAMILRLPLEPDEFDARLAALVKLGEQPDKQDELGQAIWNYDLLSLPHTDSLMRLVQQIAEQRSDDPEPGVFARLRPRFQPVLESCADGKLSDAWWIDGGHFTSNGIAGRLSADAAHSEAIMRLLGSEHITDGFIEATVKKVNGSFWLYARRTADHFVRFGFDESRQIYLQVWKFGRPVATRTQSWTLPEEGARIRLEVRGAGLIGSIDGTPVFSAPLEIPSDLGLGWIGASTFLGDRGTAQADLSQISAGPLLPRVVLLPPMKTEEDVDTLLDQLRPEFGSISDLAPRWFHIGPNGDWTETLGEDEQLLRLFARYCRMRLVPVIKTESTAALTGADLMDAAEKYNVEGFTLIVDQLPAPAWFEKLEGELTGTPLLILVMVVDPVSNTGQLRGIGKGATAFKGETVSQAIVLSPWFTPEGAHYPLTTLPMHQAVVLVMPGALPESPPVADTE